MFYKVNKVNNLFRHLSHRWRFRNRRMLRLAWRVQSLPVRLCGVALIYGGTDCDGMRWATCSYFWTAEAAEKGLEMAYYWADGPMGGRVVTSSEGRAWEREYEPDTRDRFAEAMNY